MVSATRQRLSFDVGRVSTIRTVSPILQALSSSCALYLTWRVTYLPYLACFTRRSTWTTTVFIILFDVTTPTRDLGRPRSMVISSLRLAPDAQRTLALQRESARELLLRLGQVGGGIQPATPQLHPHVEDLPLQVHDLGVQVRLRHGANLGGGHLRAPSSRASPTLGR